MNLRDIYKPVRSTYTDFPVEYIAEDIERKDIRMDMDYQRDHVWTEEQQKSFVGFVLEGGTPPTVFINNIHYESEGYMEVVDGKQRFTALLRWVKGEIPALLMDGREIKRSDITTSLMPLTVPVRYVQLSRQETLDFYIKLNSGGTTHSAEEIEKVRDLLANH